jgi:hypothetical protein
MLAKCLHFKSAGVIPQETAHSNKRNKKKLMRYMVLILPLVLDIVKLLTTKNFPNDSYIQKKSKLVEKAIERYLNGQNIICLNNCTDSNHGECNTRRTTPFLLGTCECRSGWKGNDCSKRGESIPFANLIIILSSFFVIPTKISIPFVKSPSWVTIGCALNLVEIKIRCWNTLKKVFP